MKTETRQKGLQSNCGPMLSMLYLVFICYYFSSFKWIDIFRTDFLNGFFGILLIFMENCTFWFENFYKKVIGKVPKKVWKM